MLSCLSCLSTREAHEPREVSREALDHSLADRFLLTTKTYRRTRYSSGHQTISKSVCFKADTSNEFEVYYIGVGNSVYKGRVTKCLVSLTYNKLQNTFVIVKYDTFHNESVCYRLTYYSKNKIYKFQGDDVGSPNLRNSIIGTSEISSI